MSFYVVYNVESGEIVKNIRRHDDQNMDPVTDQGLSFFETDIPADPVNHYVEDGVFLDRVALTGVSQDKSQFLANGTDSVTLGNLPAGIFIKVNDDLVMVSDTSHVFLSTVPGWLVAMPVGKYKAEQPWVLQAVTDEQYMTDVRAQRDALLTQSDWTQTGDAPLTDEVKQAWRTYRQALRDITTQTPPVTWPVPPQ